MQCCGSRTIYSGSGSYLEKAPDPDPDPNPDPDAEHILHSFSKQNKFAQDLAFSMFEAAL